MVCFLAGIELLRFWPKTMDYKSGVLMEIEAVFCGPLLLTGRCYGAGISTILSS